MKTVSVVKDNYRGLRFSYTIGIFIFLYALVLYIFTLTKNWSDDAISYAYMTKLADNIFSAALYHPHHLLYSAVGFIAYKTITVFLHCTNVLFILQTLNSILAASTLVAFFVLLRSVGINNFLSFLFCIGLSFTHTFWFCATDVEPQMAPLTFYILAIILLVKIDKTRFAYLYSFIIGLFCAMTVLLHQSSALFCLSILIGFFLFLQSRKRYICVVLYLMSATIITTSVYLAVAIHIYGIKKIEEFIHFVTYYHYINIAGLRFFTPANFIRGIYTLFKIMLYMPLTSIRGFLESPFSFYGLLNITVILLTGFVYVVSFASLFKEQLPSMQKNLKIISISWFSIYLIYININEAPYFIEQYLNVLLPLWIIFAILSNSLYLRVNSKKIFYATMATFILFLFLWNYFIFARASADIRNNTRYKNAVMWKGKSLPGDIFLTFSWNPYFEYFAQRKVIKIGNYFPNRAEYFKAYNLRLKRRIDKELKKGSNIYLLGLDVVLESQHVQDYLRKVSKTCTVANIENFFSRYNLNPIETEFGMVYKIETR
ncbi:MAG: hypothetical protein V2A72_04190 [Candidatus Omnitrophota bacterium]